MRMGWLKVQNGYVRADKIEAIKVRVEYGYIVAIYCTNEWHTHSEHKTREEAERAVEELIKFLGGGYAGSEDKAE